MALALMACTVANTGAAAQATATPVDTSCPGMQATPLATAISTPNTATPQSEGGNRSVVDQAGLVEALESCGLVVGVTGTAEQPFLQPQSGSILRLSGAGLEAPADVQVYQYDDSRGVDADVAHIGPDGHPDTMMITWIAPPHFFSAERLIVIYVGEDEVVVEVLSQILGPPFAEGT